MNNNFWKSKGGRWAIIAIVYAVCYIVAWIAWEIEARSGGMQGNVTTVIMLISFVLGLPFANKAVNYINNAIFGNLFLFGPLQMFLQIFLIKLVARVFIALLAGPCVAPYTLGKFIADQIGAE